MFTCLMLMVGCGGRPLPAGGGDAGVDPGKDGQAAADHGTTPGPDGGPSPNGRVEVTTPDRAYKTDEQPQGTATNNSVLTVWARGCAIFDRQWRARASDPWQDRGPVMACGWEGNARRLGPGDSIGQVTGFHLPGLWRVVLPYGLGCKKDRPMAPQHCASIQRAYSAQITVTVGKGTCQAINNKYRAALDQAKKCNPHIFLAQCLQKVQSDLACGCPLFVQDRKKLDLLAKQYSDYACHKVLPPCGIKCSPPQPATCAKDGKCRPK